MNDGGYKTTVEWGMSRGAGDLCDISKGVFGAIDPLNIIFLQQRIDSLEINVCRTKRYCENKVIRHTFLMSGILGENRWEI